MLIHTQLIYFLSHLHDAEHAGFGKGIVNQIGATLAAIGVLAPRWEAFERAVDHEHLMFRISKASPETREISATDKARDRDFREVKHRLKFYARGEDAALKHAADELLFWVKPFKDAAERNLFEETAFIRSFLAKIYEPENVLHVAAIPGLDSLLTTLDGLNVKLDELYSHRMQALGELKAMGKRTDVRAGTDHAFIFLLEGMNAMHEYLLMSGSDPGLKSALEQCGESVSALISQLQKVIAHRKHGRRKPDEDGQAAVANNKPQAAENKGQAAVDSKPPATGQTATQETGPQANDRTGQAAVGIRLPAANSTTPATATGSAKPGEQGGRGG